MAIKELAERYYASMADKTEEWQDVYADEVVFADASRVLKAEGKAAAVQSFAQFLKSVADMSVKQLIVEDNSACAVVHYRYVNPKGETMNQDVAEVWEVEDDKLARLTIYFDLAAYRAFMRGS